MSTKSNLKSEQDEGKRDFLIVSTYALAGVGAAAFVWPLIDQMNPAADTLALASTEIDLSAKVTAFIFQFPEGKRAVYSEPIDLRP